MSFVAGYFLMLGGVRCGDQAGNFGNALAVFGTPERRPEVDITPCDLLRRQAPRFLLAWVCASADELVCAESTGGGAAEREGGGLSRLEGACGRSVIADLGDGSTVETLWICA